MGSSAITVKDVIWAFPDHFKNPKTAYSLANHWILKKARVRPVTRGFRNGRAVCFYPANTITRVRRALIKAGKLPCGKLKVSCGKPVDKKP